MARSARSPAPHGRATLWLTLGLAASAAAASCSIRHYDTSTTTTSVASAGGGGQGGMGGGTTTTTAATTGAGGMAPLTAKDIYKADAHACLVTQCGGCHQTQGISDIYFLGDGTPDGAYSAISTYPGIVVKDPTESKLIVHPDTGHGFPDLPGPTWGDVAKSDKTCKDKVLTWLKKEADELPVPDNDGGPKPITPFKPHLGAFNTIYLDEIGPDFKDASISFYAAEVGNDPLLLQLSTLQVHAVAGKPLHLVNPLFTVYPPGPDAAPDPDPIDSFAGLDAKFAEDTDPTLGTGMLILTNWVKDGRLSFAFELVELAGGGGPPVVNCNAPDSFTGLVAPAMHYCADNCHGGLQDPALLLPQAKAQMDLTALKTDPGGTCVKVRAWITPGEPDQSQILLNTDPTGTAAHIYKFKGKYGNPAMPNDVNSFLYFKDQVTPWINAEK
ncbi:MAG: hypothetical protein U0359_02955 [Byssovorax sp.]